MRKAVTGLFVALTLASLAAPARAALPDEIQVYTDDINAPGESGLELHVNTTPRGLRTSGYPGEVPTDRGLRITPEFSWGWTRDLELGLYLPLSIQAGNASLAGYKARIKWLPIRGSEAAGGYFAGANLEVSNIQGKFNAARHNAELRIMLGHRSRDWMLALNPVFGWALSSSQENPPARNPQFAFSTKITRRIAEGLAVGVEYYNQKGTWRNFDPAGEQGKTLYVVADVDNKVMPFNIGIGRGLNEATDRWTVKAIFDVPF